MTKEQFEREKTYQVIMAIVRRMYKEEIITSGDLAKIDGLMLEKYTPLLGALYAGIP